MEIILNGSPLEIQGIDGEVTILQLLKTVEGSLQGTGNTIVELLLDEQSFSPDEADKLSELKVLRFNRIELVAATAEEMIQAAFEDGESGIAHLEEIAGEVSADLRLGKVKAAMDNYIEFVDGVEWLVTVISNAERAFAAKMAESSIESNRQALLGRVSEQMTAVKSAQESEDWVLLADLLEYEYPEILADAKALIKQIMEP
ncbi:MAG TPA: hypothetical protein PLM07_09575 [Candidatus Rifleibacterium sp.]|nr:hypothetical protein [Candidatus Rifleibacterium sp.]HPT46138.1 hypothetical protein [Candidatus Rifleibacterium sp.]